ncbi:MAG TPA: hypothetical protein VJL39_03460 [Candidatus Paceibacterota bacterium]
MMVHMQESSRRTVRYVLYGIVAVLGFIIAFFGSVPRSGSQLFGEDASGANTAHADAPDAGSSPGTGGTGSTGS